MRKSIMRLLAIATLALAITSAPQKAEANECIFLWLDCMYSGGFPMETGQECQAPGWMWQGFECYYPWGYTWGAWCGPLYQCEVPVPCGNPPCDA